VRRINPTSQKLDVGHPAPGLVAIRRDRKMESKAVASPEKSAVDKRPERDLPSWAYLLIALAGIWIIVSLETSDWNTYRVLDDYGWIEHDHDTPVWIKGEWLAGEYRVCQMPLVPWQPLPDSAHLLCAQRHIEMDEDAWPPDFIDSISEIEFVELVAGKWSPLEHHFHILPVNYWGRINRSDRTMFSWRCQRTTNGLECKALN